MEWEGVREAGGRPAPAEEKTAVPAPAPSVGPPPYTLAETGVPIFTFDLDKACINRM